MNGQSLNEINYEQLDDLPLSHHVEWRDSPDAFIDRIDRFDEVEALDELNFDQMDYYSDN